MTTSSSAAFWKADKINTGMVHQLSASPEACTWVFRPSARAPR